MTKRSLWRLAIVLAVVFGCGYFFTPLSKVKLGLDLRGGVHFELEVQGQEALAADLRDSKDRLVARLKEKGLPDASAIVDGTALRIEGVNPDQRATVEKVTKDFFSGYALVVDGSSFRLSQKADYQKQLKDDANKRALEVIEKRIRDIDPANVLEPEITASGAEGNRIVVEIPGIEEGDRERIKKLLATPGHLEQRLLAKAPQLYFATKEDALAAYKGQIPPEFELLPEIESDRQARRGGQSVVKAKPGEEKISRWILLESRIAVDGADIIDAHRASNSQTEANEVNFTLNKKGGDDFARLTGTAADENRLIAIVLDHKIVTTLSAKEKIIGGAVRISGSFTAQEADDLASQLRSGALRAPMKFLEERVVGPGLGRDSIHSGVMAAAIGFAAIIAFMVYFYHWSGANAIVALTVNVIVMMGLLGSFRATLTLPGIAGFVLTLGMAVDANILIFERIKEELGLGKSVPGAIDAGFNRVFWTIVDSHVTQLFAALLLFIFGTGPVKGFAVTLTVGVVASLFTSIYISRYIYDWILERHPGTKTLSVGTHTFFKGSSYDFMKYKAQALAISWGIILLCVLWVRPWNLTHNNRIQLGMQFVGGNDMTVRFRGAMEPETIREALAKNGYVDATVVAYENKDKSVRDFAVKVKAKKDGDQKDSTKQANALRAIFKQMDPEGTSNPLPALNLEGSKTLTDTLARVNPAGIGGDDAALQAAYTPFAEKVIAGRDRLPSGLYQSFSELPQDLPQVVKDSIQKSYRLGAVGLLKDESFSPSISGEWTRKTLTAVAWALGAILVYVMFRFTASYAVGGIVSLLHDMLMALALFAAFGYEFNVPVVASFLTLMGYSMADTIVVFDRIRENGHRPEYRRATVTKLVNDSINQTLGRTILTSASVLFVSVCLWLFGGPALKDLAFPLVIGVITGTYSSIYIASPVVVYWDKWFGGKDKLKQHA
ncbi:protein translocase subunit SecD [Geothrix sp. 21YS21S-4]|uniref:protein translocase subunit SecD n=1 Tax=Geothrix sp. 21YS21S-4 TaxID=3068889 RepID=UPI0027BAFC5B|nr:protein translocase subunit SecD [Geothrix sp. 21YS21S-4]